MLDPTQTLGSMNGCSEAEKRRQRWGTGHAARRREDGLLGARTRPAGDSLSSPARVLPRFGWDTTMGRWDTGVELAAGWRLM